MLTPQEVSSSEFEKAVFGGYDTASVDKFLTQVTQDYSALYRENGILKNKMKVLVDKVEEYRSTEDAMRMALLQAERTAKEMLTAAEAEPGSKTFCRIVSVAYMAAITAAYAINRVVFFIFADSPIIYSIDKSAA